MKLATAIGVLVVLLAGSAAAWFVLSEDELDPELEKHLKAEARRLAANPEAIEQEDARWIADQLGRNPSARRLYDLIEERSKYQAEQAAERLKKDYPDFWDYPTHRAKSIKGTNGIDALNAVKELVDELREDERFKSYVVLRKGPLDDETAEAFLKETAPVATAIRKALEADVIVHFGQRLDSMLDEIEFPVTYYIVGLMVAKAKLQKERGDLAGGTDTVTLALRLHSRLESNNGLIPALFHVVSADLLFDLCVRPYALEDEVSTGTLREWLALGTAAELDFVTALAVELSDMRRQVVADAELLKGAPELMIDERGARSVEDYFREVNAYADMAFTCADYARKERRSLRDVAAVVEAFEALEVGTPISVGANLRDAAKFYWRWAGLEMRILQRESGPLIDQREAVEEKLKQNWPALTPKWKEDGTLELWLNHEVLPFNEPTKPLTTLTPAR